MWRALLTRAHGPGMVAPTVTDAEPLAGLPSSSAAGAACSAAAAMVQGAPLATSTAQPQPQPQPQEAGPAFYPWEHRPLGPLDWYTTAAFFLLTLPGSLAYLLAATDGSLRRALHVQ